jgi:hypothetical protein
MGAGCTTMQPCTRWNSMPSKRKAKKQTPRPNPAPFRDAVRSMNLRNGGRFSESEPRLFTSLTYAPAGSPHCRETATAPSRGPKLRLWAPTLLGTRRATATKRLASSRDSDVT